MSSKVNQKEYLKKYLSGEKKKHKSKRKTRDASRESSRVKIIDDDVDTRRKNYDDDDTDLILTGEDAPQIVGIVDERPSDLKTYEDFRTSGKWKSLSSNNHNASSYSHEQERKTHRRSRERQRDDYRKSTETPPRRNRSQDLSPVRRRRHGSEESVTRYERNTSNRKREFNSNRSDRRENVIHNDSKRGRDDNNAFGRKSFESKQSWKEDYSHKPSCRNDSPPRNNFDRINRKNDSNTKYHQSDYRRDMSDDRNKYNPFRSTFDNKQNKHSEPEHNMSSANDKYYNNRGKANPFRSKPMLSSVSNSVSSEKRPSSSLPRQKRFDSDSHSFKQYNSSQGSRYNPFRNDLPQRSEDTGSKQFSNDRSFDTRKRDFTDNKKYPLREKFAPDQRGSFHYHNKNPDNWNKEKFSYKGSDESKGYNNRRNVSGFDRNQYKHGDFRNGRNFKDDKRNMHEEKNSFHFSNSFKKRSHDDLPTSSRNSDQRLRDGRFERRNDAKRSRWDNNDNSSTSCEKKSKPYENKSDDDLSPVRKRSPHKHADKHISRDGGSKRGYKESYDDRHDTKVKSTLDGKRAGLQSARMLKAENDKIRKREDEMFKKMPEDVSGKNAEAVVRNMGRRAQFEEDLKREEEKAKREMERKRVYSRWGKGLKQIEAYENKVMDEIHEMSKPLARYSDDADLDKMLKSQQRIGDPMLNYMRRKQDEKNKKDNVQSTPIYQGQFPENRFNIRPGYRWDGIDRSNGYEVKWFDEQSRKKAVQEEAYKYSTEDM